MAKFECGGRIMTDVITLNGRNQPMWNYLLKTFVNVCGKCYRKPIKFQYMENKLMEMEKQRMEMFLENEDEEQDTYFDLIELKEHLRTLPPNERHKVKDFERLRNLANGQDPDEGMDEIDMAKRNWKRRKGDMKTNLNPKTERDSKNYLKKRWLYIVRGCYLLVRTVDVVGKKLVTYSFIEQHFSCWNLWWDM